MIDVIIMACWLATGESGEQCGHMQFGADVTHDECLEQANGLADMTRIKLLMEGIVATRISIGCGPDKGEAL